MSNSLDAKSDLPTEAELAAIRRGATFVLVGFVFSLLAHLVCTGAEYLLDNPGAPDAPRLRPGDVPDPDFAYLMPFLMVVLLALLVEAGGKIMALSRPERWRYGLLHVALAFDLLSVVGIMLRFFNYGRTEGPLVVALVVIQYCAAGSSVAMALFVGKLAARLGRRSLVVLTRVFLTTTALGLTVGVFIDPAFAIVDLEAVEASVFSLVWLSLAAIAILASIGTYIALLAKVQGLVLSPPSLDHAS